MRRDKTGIQSSLCKYRLEDEAFFTDEQVTAAIKQAFKEHRCFCFYPNQEIVRSLKAGSHPALFRENFLTMLTEMLQQTAEGDTSALRLLEQDHRLTMRLIFAMTAIHEAMATRSFGSLFTRRFVLIREPVGVPTIYHLSEDSTVISHVGQGPNWIEMPSIYLGLNIFNTIQSKTGNEQKEIMRQLSSLLMIEERAIETGYIHETTYPAEISLQILQLTDAVVAHITHDKSSGEKLLKSSAAAAFSNKEKKSILADLDARIAGDELNFDYAKNIKAVDRLEALARKYKTQGDEASLREIVKLLVPASGHDIHEVRNRANIALERIFAPKEFDAPLAVTFINTAIGETVDFSFDLQVPDDEELYIRLYKSTKSIPTLKDISFEDIKLHKKEKARRFECSHRFDEYGHVDFAVVSINAKNFRWISAPGASGRINITPGVKGEIILEIFPDIHGHTKAYWMNNDGHPGLLYNENGEVIRTGTLADVTNHLEYIHKNYFVSVIYLLGTQKRGTNREDWAQEATSPSPFSPQSLVDIEPSLGGEQALKELIAKAHSLDIKIILDIMPHINRKSMHLPDEFTVMTYDDGGHLVARSSTDGRYGSWNDGRLLNYRKFEVWEWLAWSVCTLIDTFDIDGVRFDSAHAVPIMMKKNNYPFTFGKERTHEEMAEGTIIVNDKEQGHFITTGYYDCACRDQIAVPIHYYLMLEIAAKLKEKQKNFFINIAECFWGHERFLTRTGLIPYNSSLFKICENIIHGKSDVREIYHLYDDYFSYALPQGTELLGILGNHDERRALNTFGQRGLRAAIGLTFFMHDIVMDYEGSAEGESWKVFLDNIYVNWNSFESVATRSLDHFYKSWYKFHNTNKGKGYLIWANNYMTAAAMKFTGDTIWIGAFNFADSNQNIAMQFDNPALPIPDDACYRLSDIVYSKFTDKWSYYTGKELKISRIRTVVPFTDRVKIFQLETVSLSDNYSKTLTDSFLRLAELDNTADIRSSFAFSEIVSHCKTYEELQVFLTLSIKPLCNKENNGQIMLAIKRATFYLFKLEILSPAEIKDYTLQMLNSDDIFILNMGKELAAHNRRGSLVFMSAEADPFSKSGGLANVVYELPRELVKLKETVFVITGYYKNGSDKEKQKMAAAVKKYGVKYTGINVSFFIMDSKYEVGVHACKIDGVNFFLLEHHEFFDGLYWGYTAEEKLRRRIAFARACAEVITVFNLRPHYTFTNDANIGLFNGIVRCDPYYAEHDSFKRNTYLHILHNGGWQYFDSYESRENGFNLFNLFNLPSWREPDFCDPVFPNRLNCMATGIRFADKVITVSPSYAAQIERSCDGLERILHNVTGISNAIGRDFRKNIEERFKNSGFVENNYSKLILSVKRDAKLKRKLQKRFPEILESATAPEAITDDLRRAIVVRMRNKLLLQIERQLYVDPDAIMLCMIHRISEQKGFQLLLEASEGLFKHLGYEGIIGGATAAGDNRGTELATGLWQISDWYKDRVDFNHGYQDVAVPLLSADIFCMPSMNEPGGISQLEAFAAGCLVVARATGGLRDTVVPVQIKNNIVTGNGFLFSDYNSWAFYDAMERAAAFFKNNTAETIQQARINAENSAYYWDTPAHKYAEAIYDFTETIRLLDD